MKVDVYVCDRCGDTFHVESGKKPITVTHIDGRFINEEKTVLHLCDNCYIPFLYAMEDRENRREAFDKLAKTFEDKDLKEGKDIP